MDRTTRNEAVSSVSYNATTDRYNHGNEKDLALFEACPINLFEPADTSSSVLSGAVTSSSDEGSGTLAHSIETTERFGSSSLFPENDEALFEAALSRMEMPGGHNELPSYRKKVNDSNNDNALPPDDQNNFLEITCFDRKRPATSALSLPQSSEQRAKRHQTIAQTKQPEQQQHPTSTNHSYCTPNALPRPSEEQQAVIDAVLAGHCVTLPSVAGSGKTTCMLQVASALPPNRTVTIITYNRSLCDECKVRILKHGLADGKVVRAYTIHGLVQRVAGRQCNDDAKLREIVMEWDSNRSNMIGKRPYTMDLVLLDEAQDLRPLFYRAIYHIMRFSAGGQKPASSIQICLVGDPKQMLYDFPTFGSDKASVRYMEQPEKYWGEFTVGRTWVERKLTVSYRLTPNVASFVNAIWGTSIKGGNDRDPNVPVEYYCKYPFPPSKNSLDAVFHDENKLSTDFLDSLIKINGPENVLFLAQSVKSEKCPIRVHVNALCEMRDSSTGEQIHNFHIKESQRGYEENNDVKNKVRVWTFCGSKGCEADVVVIFGFDIFCGRVHALNQMGVALSRARKRLIVIHQKSCCKDKGAGKNASFIPNPYYPLLGDSADGIACHNVTYNGDQTLHLTVPPYVEGDNESLKRRSHLTYSVIERLCHAGIVRIDGKVLPTPNTEFEGEKKQVVYVASDFAYFSAAEETRFLEYATWTRESGVDERIDYTVGVQFSQTTEDVSALYGEALTLMLQWERHGYCPNIETVVNDGILEFCAFIEYSEDDFLKILRKKKCESLSDRSQELLRTEFGNKRLKGKDLIRLLNTRIIIQKKRVDGERTIYFRVKAMEERGKDENMSQFLNKIRSVYNARGKTPAQWVYLANAVMAFFNYVEKFHQIGTRPSSYERWVESHVLLAGLSRLMDLMNGVPSNSSRAISSQETIACIGNDEFECELIFEFPPEHHISSQTNSLVVIGIQGICDWVGQELHSPQGVAVDLLEIKFINELCNMHRLQVLTYCALLALEQHKSCSGMLYNARTDELEVCRIEHSGAKEFLLDMAQFKFNGERRHREATRKAKDQNHGVIICLEDNSPHPCRLESDNERQIASYFSGGTIDDPIVL